VLRFVSAIGDRRYGLKKLADKNFRELIYGVNLHTKPGKHYDERIALFSALCGMTEIEVFSPAACGTFAKPHPVIWSKNIDFCNTCETCLQTWSFKFSD
jgi:hypothetical protein